MSGQLYRAVVVAMIAMGMVQPFTHEIIDVIPMGHGFMPAGRTMLVRAAGLRRALHGICGVDCDDMLIDVILMQVMKMAVMEIVDMALMTDRRMPAVGTVLVGMIGMMLLGAGGHSILPSLSTVTRHAQHGARQELGNLKDSAASTLLPVNAGYFAEAGERA